MKRSELKTLIKECLIEESNVNIDDEVTKYLKYVASAMKIISPKLIISWIPKHSYVRIQLRGRKALGDEIASGINKFFEDNAVAFFGDWHSYGQPIQSIETRIEIRTLENDAIVKKINNTDIEG